MAQLFTTGTGCPAMRQTVMHRRKDRIFIPAIVARDLAAAAGRARVQSATKQHDKVRL